MQFVCLSLTPNNACLSHRVPIIYQAKTDKLPLEIP